MSNPTINLPLIGEVQIKYFSLICLVLQNVVLVLSIGYSRNHKGEDGLMYVSATAVVTSELLKLITASLLEYIFETKSNESFYNKMYSEFFNIDTVKLAVPGILYVIQNNLLFLSLSHLSVAVYQVSAQVKILTTAMFSFIMLGTRTSYIQTISLFVLTAGVAVVQVANADDSAKVDSSAPEKNQVIGLIAILSACMTSGFAGIYFEKILKKGRSVTLYIRNVQLAFFGVTFGLVQAYAEHGDIIRENGFFQGYTTTVWVVVCTQALGGLMVAVVMRYADNILKGFATSCAIVLGSIFSAMILGTPITGMFTLGAAFVVAAVYMYGAYPPTAAYVALPKLTSSDTEDFGDLDEGEEVELVQGGRDLEKS